MRVIHAALLWMLLIAALATVHSQPGPFHERMGIAHGYTSFANGYLDATALDYATHVGKWARIECWWSQVQVNAPSPTPVYDWNLIDALIGEFDHPDQEIILVLGYAPDWAAERTSFPPDPPDTPHDMAYVGMAPSALHAADWAAFCAAAALHFTTAFNNVNTFEIYNEPNSHYFYRIHNGSMPYPEALRLALNAIKGVSQDLVVLCSGAQSTIVSYSSTANSCADPSDLDEEFWDSWPIPLEGVQTYDMDAQTCPPEWIEYLYSYDFGDESSIGDYFDALAFHPYANVDDHDPLYEYSGPGECGFGYWFADGHCRDSKFLFTEDIHRIMSDHGDGDKKIWATEMGLGAPEQYDHSADLPAEFLSKQESWIYPYYSKWFSWEFTGPILWYQIVDVRSGTDPDYVYDHHGLLSWDRIPYPAYNAVLEWSNSGPGSFEFHIGDGPDFSYHDLDADLAYKIALSASTSETVRIYFHAKDDAYYGSFSLLHLDTLPANTTLEHLEIIGVGADRSSTEAATPGTVVLDALGDRSTLRLNGQIGLTLRNITSQNVYNSDTPREGDPNLSVSSLLHSAGGAVHLENCQFIDISTGGTGIIDPGGVLSYVAPEGISGFVTIKNCLFADCAGPQAGVADVTRGSVTVEGCTFHKSSGSSSGNCSIRTTSGPVELLGCLFTGSTDGSATSVQLLGGGSLQASYCLFDTQASGYNLTGVGNLFVTPGEAMEQVRYVDTDQGDFRLRWDSACLDRGDPNPANVDFDQTRSDIGWRPHYPVVEISGNTEITEPGHYLVVGGSATLSGPNTVIPEGTTVKIEGSSVLHMQDTNPSGGHMITVGDPNGARTAIVGPTTTGYILFGEYGIGIPATTCQFHGVLFNRMRPGSFVQFMNCNVDLNGANGNVAFNDYANAQIIFHEVCRGTFRNINFTTPQIWGGTVGLGSLSLIASDVDLLNVTFNPVPGGQNYGYWKVWVSGMAPGNANQVIAGCTIPCNDNAHGVYPLFTQDAALTLHHNQFTDIQQGAIYMYASTLDMANGAVNTFDKPSINSVLDGNPILIGWGGNVDLHCGYNSIIYGDVSQVDHMIAAPCFTGDWRSNFWGLNCTTPIDPGSYLPTCVSNYLPTLSSCPSLFTPCEDQMGEDSPLYALGADADADANYEAACAYWTALMVEFPTSKYCTKVTGAMKAIGLVTEYGVESYGLIRSNLEAAAAESEPVDFLLSVSQRCAAWCVEARHGDRPAALGLLNALLAQVNGNKDAKVLINAAIAEIGTYPLPGAMSAMQPGMEIARLEQQTQQLRAFQLALLPEETRARLAQEDVVETQSLQPLNLKISRVYPNPFNPVAMIELVSRGDLPLLLEIYNLAGQRVATLQNGMVSAGSHRLQWDASDLASGLYFLRAEQGTKQEISKLMLIR